MASRIVLILSLLSAGYALNCSSSFFSWDGDDLCYGPLPGPFDYNEGSTQCTLLGGLVAALHSNEQFVNCTKFMTKGLLYYVNTNKTGDFFMWYDGTPINKDFWLPGEPNMNKGDCVVYDYSVFPSGLRVVNCSSLNGVLCFERPSQECASSLSYNSFKYTLTSVNYPNHYYNDINCSTTIRSVDGGIVNVIFTDFRVEYPWDYVTLYDGQSTSSPVIRKITSMSEDFVVSSTANNLTMLFTTDSTNTAPGWSADIIPGKSTTPQHYGYSGTVTSPNFPGNYSANTAQFYYFNYSPNFKYQFTFNYFQTTPLNDFLYVYQGNPPRLTQSFNGTLTVPYTFNSTDSSVMMVFSTWFGGLPGFSMKYQAV